MRDTVNSRASRASAEGKRYCTVQVDVDGLWVIERLLGREPQIDPDPVFERGLERLLGLFEEFSLKATFFIVSRDLESREKSAFIERIIRSGHEIASHSATHRYLDSLSDAEARREVASSKGALDERFGIRVSGFKSPGFIAARGMVAMLEDAGYEYDSSVFGTSLASLMERFSGLSYPKRAMLWAPASPYLPSRADIFDEGASGIVEIPVTALPALRLPIHFSYLLLGGGFYARFVRAALARSRLKFVNYLFHPLDLVDRSSYNGRIYGLKKDAKSKMAMAREMLGFLRENYEIVTSKEMSSIVRTIHPDAAS